jgi:hypothetical protein
MPTYEYVDPKSGEEFELRRPWQERDVPGLIRREVPSRLGNVVSHRTKELSTDQQTQKTLREMEIRGDFKGSTKQDVKLMKDAWYTEKYNHKAPKTAAGANLVTT